MGKSALIIYYSRGGENYVNGSIVNLDVGNTHVAAETLARLTDGDLFRLVPVNDYSLNYDTCVAQTQRALSDGVRPELTAFPASLDPYDLILLGYPTYWGAPPMPVMTFLHDMQLDGRTVLPFCTHEGSEFGHSLENIRAACPGINLGEGVAIRGGRVTNCAAQLTEWLNSHGVDVVSG